MTMKAMNGTGIWEWRVNGHPTSILLLLLRIHAKRQTQTGQTRTRDVSLLLYSGIQFFFFVSVVVSF